MKYFVKISLTIIVIWTVYGCTESILVEPHEPTFEVSGTVYSEYCVWWLEAWFPYTDSLNITGTVTLTDTVSGADYITLTDSSSFYSQAVPEGIYFLEVEIPHGHPRITDTLTITEDITVDIYAPIEWLWHDTIIVSFYYETTDSLPLVSELALIYTLDSTYGGGLHPENSTYININSGFPSSSSAWHEYYVPFDTTIKPWLLEDELQEIINSDSLTFPTSMYVGLRRFPCLH